MKYIFKIQYKISDYIMEITFLGTSSAVHSYKRSHPSIALKAFGETMLFDCGEGTQRQLIYAKISPMKISKIFITHYHGDHILGLPGLLQSMNFRGREKKLTIYGPKGLNKVINAIYNLGFTKIDFPIEFIEIGSEIVEKTKDIEKPEAIFGVAPAAAANLTKNGNRMGLGFKYAKDNKEGINKLLSVFNIDATSEEIYYK